MIRDIHVDHAHYIREFGDDMPLVKEWKWGYYSGATAGGCDEVDGGTEDSTKGGPGAAPGDTAADQ
jgi:xylulose-5-phosphate/fructose-6-phosphate phosphoketolase